jgi:hypothetical protein
LSYFGNATFIQNKIKQFSHQELNNKTNTDIYHIEESIKKHESFFKNDHISFTNNTYIVYTPISENHYLPPLYNIYLRDYYKPTSIQLVISRFNEQLNWLKDTPFLNSYNNIIYNKGINNDFFSNDKSTITHLKNIGRCDATYLYHIINNYNNLENITIFLPGSIDSSHLKFTKTKILMNEIEKHQDTVFVSAYYNDVKKESFNFQLDEWQASDIKNKSINPESKLTPANIRPFGKWYESIFGDILIKRVSFGGIMGIHKKDILKHPKDYYEKLYQEFGESSNPEVGHYFERSWEAVFYPLLNPKYIDYV